MTEYGIGILPTHSHFCPVCHHTRACAETGCEYRDRLTCLGCENLMDEAREIQRQVELDREHMTGESEPE